MPCLVKKAGQIIEISNIAVVKCKKYRNKKKEEVLTYGEAFDWT